MELGHCCALYGRVGCEVSECVFDMLFEVCHVVVWQVVVAGQESAVLGDDVRECLQSCLSPLVE